MYNYLTLAQKKEVVKDINEVGLFLLEFYLAKTGHEGYDYTDDRVAQALDWTVRKVSKYRVLLEKYEYFSKKRYTDRAGNASYTIKVGNQKWMNKDY